MIINLTPHPLHLYPQDTPERIAVGDAAPLRVLPPSTRHQPVRLGHQVIGEEHVEDGLPVARVAFGTQNAIAEDLPQPRVGTWYVVSLVVGLAATHRTDLLVLHEYVRDLDGHVIGARRLARPQRHQPQPPAPVAEQSPIPGTPRAKRAKPWCNYAVHRTTSDRRADGSKMRKVKHGVSKRRAYRLIDQWWKQR